MVLNGWEVKSFAKLLKSGDVEKIQDGNHGDSHPKSSDFVKSGIPFVMARDLKKGTVDLENCAYITKEQADSLRIGFAKTGDILLSHKGTVGLVAIVPLCDEYMMLTPQVTYYRIPQDSSLMSSYLYQFLLSHEYQSRFKNLAFQSTRSYLGITAQKELSINLPPLQEQQKIAKILSTWDKAISTTECLIENSTQQKKALMQQLLTGKKRLLDDDGKQFAGEWEVAPLKDCVTFLNGMRKPIKQEDRADIQGQYPYFGATGIIDYVNDYIFDDELILLGEDGENILSRAVPHVFMVSGKIWVNNHAHVMKANKDKNSEFLCIYLESLDYRKFNSGSAQPKINKAVCEKIPVHFPSLNEQNKIATVLTNADKEIELLEQQLADLQQEKKALMQVLLTGKKRVVV